ncbi:hypothetical protein [Variovorax boronicumulans]|uniref:hypothetical protein n=1 Tax=Variovorax boronicumulans TaxID=436515 RepID=UPI003390A9AD
MHPPNGPSELAAEAAVQAYLCGRTMPDLLYRAIVWAVERRVSSGKLLLLDDTLTNDIDNHAVSISLGGQAQAMTALAATAADGPSPEDH